MMVFAAVIPLRLEFRVERWKLNVAEKPVKGAVPGVHLIYTKIRYTNNNRMKQEIQRSFSFELFSLKSVGACIQRISWASAPSSSPVFSYTIA